jgi:TetR/AcrR family transcriptional repressor of nem operon
MDASTPAPRITAKGQITRQRIISTAAGLFHLHGISATRLDDVKDAAGVSSSQLYLYFADKDALVKAVIAYQTDMMVDIQRTANFKTKAGRRAWRDAIVDTQRRRNCEGGCPLGSLTYEVTKPDADAREIIAASFRRWQEILESDLRMLQSSGKLSYEQTPQKLAMASIAAVQGGLLLCHAQRSTEPLEAALDSILEFIDALSLPAH